MKSLIISILLLFLASESIVAQKTNFYFTLLTSLYQYYPESCTRRLINKWDVILPNVFTDCAVTIDGKFYASSGITLYELDTLNGTLQKLGDFNEPCCMSCLAADVDGRLYSSFATNGLHAYNTKTGLFEDFGAWAFPPYNSNDYGVFRGIFTGIRNGNVYSTDLKQLNSFIDYGGFNPSISPGTYGVSYAISCDSTIILGVTPNLFKLSLNDPKPFIQQEICDTLLANGMAITPLKQTAKCDLYIDLDADDSAGLDGFDHPDSIYCALTQSPICDITDAKVFAEGKIDSIRINISGNLNLPNEYLTFPSSTNISVVTINPSHLVLVNNGGASNSDYTQFIRGIRYRIDGSRTPGTRLIKFRIFAYGDSSIPAICKLRIDPLIWAGDDNSIQVCQASPSINLNTLINGTPGGTWSWNNGDFNPAIDPSQIVHYIVTNPKCPADSAFIDVKIVPLPSVLLPADSSVCSNIGFQPFIISAGGNNLTQLTWQDGSNGSTFLVNTFGTYSLIATNGVACADTASFTLTSLPAPTAVLTGASAICPNESSLIVASGGLSFLWNDGSNNASLLAASPGWYAVTITNAFNCSDSASLIISIAPPIIAEPSLTPPKCLGDNNGQLTGLDIQSGLEPIAWQVFDNLNNPADKNALSSGDYTLVLTDAIGCKDSLGLYIPEGSGLAIDLGQDLTLAQGASFTLSPIVISGTPIQYDWTPIGYFDSINFDVANFTATQSTTINLVATDINGCKASDFIQVKVDNQVKIYVPNAFSPNGDGDNDRFGIYADPAIWFIDQFAVYGRWGQQVFQANNISPDNPGLGWDGTAQGKPVDEGVYVWQAQLRNVNGSRKQLSGEVMVLR